MKLYIRPVKAAQVANKTISRCGEYELAKTAKGSSMFTILAAL